MYWVSSQITWWMESTCEWLPHTNFQVTGPFTKKLRASMKCVLSVRIEHAMHCLTNEAVADQTVQTSTNNHRRGSEPVRVSVNLSEADSRRIIVELRRHFDCYITETRSELGTNKRLPCWASRPRRDVSVSRPFRDQDVEMRPHPWKPLMCFYWHYISIHKKQYRI